MTDYKSPNKLYIFRHTKKTQDMVNYLRKNNVDFQVYHVFKLENKFDKIVEEILRYSMYGFTDILSNSKKCRELMDNMTYRQILQKLLDENKLARAFIYVGDNGERYNSIDTKGRPKYENV
jgi:arsenate reductase-like glutaredoxin family protein